MTSPDDYLVDEEPSLAEQFEFVLRRQAELNGLFDRAQKPRALARSRIAADNQATSPVQLEHLVSYCLLQAIDCGRAMTRAVRAPDGSLELPIMALYPLARGQIECAAMAAWVMAPKLRRDRVLRRLQVGHDEISKEKALVVSAIGGRGDSEANKARRAEAVRERRRKSHLRAVAKANGIDPGEYENTVPAWEARISEAGRALGIPNDGLAVVWRLASGLSHPSLTRGTSVLDFTTVSEEGNVLSGVMSTKTESLTAVISLGERAARGALQQWRVAKIQPNDEQPVPVVSF
ncbi:hypothetical protein ACFY9N_03990 [Microbacterium sp. NPDC008134]|uniref:hypothetical protein n=1 Tax=Microbacterium sp. NPDC008134 TaxID=3364183 RepID=UPI0036EBA4D4